MVIELNVKEGQALRLYSLCCTKEQRLDESRLQDMTLGLFLLGFTGLVPGKPEGAEMEPGGPFRTLELPLPYDVSKDLQYRLEDTLGHDFISKRDMSEAAQSYFVSGYYAVFPEDFTAEKGGEF